MQREGYWDYMGRKLRESHMENINVGEDIMKKEIAEMQKQVHCLLVRIKELNDIVSDLEYKVILKGGDPDQVEMKF